MGRPVVSVRDVDKVYGNGTVALKDVDLTVKEGEFISLLGPSGCGKSTLLRLMAGLGEVSAGKVNWWEQDYSVVGEKGRKLAFVFQNATLMPWARVRKNVRLPLDLNRDKGDEAEQRIDQALEMVGLSKFGDAYPGSCPAACRCACPSPGPWSPAPTCCSWTNPSAPLTR